MLVLSRRRNESIVIGNEIRIVVVEVRGDRVRLGIEAPRDHPIHRAEVLNAIREEREAVFNSPSFVSPDDADVMLG